MSSAYVSITRAAARSSGISNGLFFILILSGGGVTVYIGLKGGRKLGGAGGLKTGLRRRFVAKLRPLP